jgi:hypothetical protein
MSGETTTVNPSRSKAGKLEAERLAATSRQQREDIATLRARR